MKDDNPHFLDTNIFLSIALPDKNMELCRKYFGKNYDKYTSQKVKIESYSVINKLELLSGEILKEIEEYIESNRIPDEVVPDHMKIIQRNVLKKYSSDDYPFGFKKDKFEKLTKELFKTYFNILNRNNAYLPIIQLVNQEKINYENSFKNSNNALNNLFSEVYVLDFTKNHSDDEIIMHLEEYGIHPPDSHILLDCYKSSLLLEDYIAFITMDNGILKGKNFIYREFKSNICVKHPDEYLNS